MMNEKDILESLGRRIEERRRDKGLTIDQLATGTKIGRTTLSKIEKGETNTRFMNVYNVAHYLDTSVSDLLGEYRPEVRNYSGTMDTLEHMLRHEERVLEWERRGGVRRMILPFFSVIHQTERVTLYIREHGCYNYSALGKSQVGKRPGSKETEDLESFEEIIAKRREVFSGLTLSREIASGPEITKFARGQGEFEGLNAEERREQLDHVIGIVKAQIPTHNVEIHVLQNPIYIMVGLYGVDRVTIRGRGIYVEILDTDIMEKFIENFNDLWEQSLGNDRLIDFLEEQKKEIK